MELFTATGNLNKFFLQLQLFDVCTAGDMAHIHTIFRFLPRDLADLKARMIAVVKNIDAPMLTRVGPLVFLL
jgi:hypothetical protein